MDQIDCEVTEAGRWIAPGKSQHRVDRSIGGDWVLSIGDTRFPR
jgi:hypothetical protein